ncbi:unnamed protein product [Amoebophrya sp. A120]|nr:unnamed protein product [Amoebophrya sp. A120]|eukprot:GSA120T00025601001.1
MSLNSKSCSLKTAVAAVSGVTTVYFPAPTSAVEMLTLDKSRRDKLQRRKSQKAQHQIRADVDPIVEGDAKLWLPEESPVTEDTAFSGITSTPIRVADLVKDQTKIFSDRSYVLNGIPNYQDDCMFVPVTTADGENQGAWLAENRPTDSAVTFTVTRAATVFLDMWRCDKMTTEEWKTAAESDGWSRSADLNMNPIGLVLHTTGAHHGSPLEDGGIYGPGQVYRKDVPAGEVSVPGLGTKTSFYGVWVCPDESETPIVADAGVYWRPGAEPEACAQEAGEAGVCGNSGDTPCAIVKGDEEVDEEEGVTETTEGCC